MRLLLRRLKRLVWPSKPYSTEEWNQQYASAQWSYLSNLEQAPRYAVIEGWRRRLKPGGSVLDLGCGEGVLFDHIPPSAQVAYIGVDLAQTAIDMAVRRVRDPLLERFVCADLVTFEPDRDLTFDVIIFNEVLHYLPDAPAVLRRYRELLAPDGLIIVSVFHNYPTTWRMVDTQLANERMQTIFVRDFLSKKGWYLGLYQHRSRP